MIPEETKPNGTLDGKTPGAESNAPSGAESNAPSGAGSNAPSGAESNAPAAAASLEAKEEEVRALIDRLKRLQAEFDNYRKRILRDLATVEERSADREILAFLPLYDNLARAFSVYAKDAIVEDFVSGIERIFGQFAQILDQKGVERVPTVGERFDPALHEALLSIHSPIDRNVILEEFSPGYTRGERTLQPSKVSVSQGPALKEEEEK